MKKYIIQISFLILTMIFISFLYVLGYNYLKENMEYKFNEKYHIEVKFNGDKKIKNINKLIYEKLDVLNKSDIEIKEVKNKNKYIISINKNNNLLQAITSISKKGYLYILDEDGNDILATTSNNNGKTWIKREKRLITNEVFDKMNLNNESQNVFIELKIINEDVIKILKDNPKNYYIYHDIGEVLNSLRRNKTGLKTIANIINNENDIHIKNSLLSILDNEIPYIITGKKMLNLINTSDKIFFNNLNLNPIGIKWKYDDTLNSYHKLTVDPNNDKNTYNPLARFDYEKYSVNQSPMNAWLPHIKNLILETNISKKLDDEIIKYPYNNFWLGKLKLLDNKIIINKNISYENILNILNNNKNGKSNNNFTIISIA